MTHFLTLGSKVFDIVFSRADFDWNPFHHFQSVTFQPHNFPGIVCHQADLAQPKFLQDLRAYSLFPQVGLEPQSFIGLHGVLALVLQGIGFHFVDDPNAAPFLIQIQ